VDRLYYADLAHLKPELTLIIAAALLALLDLFLPKSIARNRFGWISLVALAVSGAFAYNQIDNDPVALLGQTYRIDGLAVIIKLFLLLGTAFVILLSYGSKKEQTNPHLGEYYYLLLPATLGGFVMASSGDLVTLYVGLELLSITSYILVGIRTNSSLSMEAAFKYIVLGGIASAFILYGMSFLYGISGSTQLVEINTVLSEFDPSMGPMVYVSLFLLLIGFSFKIAAAPFHAWAPDVYQGAPTSVAAYLAVVSKIASFAMIARVVYNTYFGVSNGGYPISDDLLLLLSIIAATAMIVGNALALKQRNMKRLLAYSGVANSGYLLVPLAASFGDNYMHVSNINEFLFYAFAYLFMTLGAFTVVLVVARVNGSEEMSAFAGLYYRAPWTAAAMVIFILSLAGLPISAGFIGKAFILLGAISVKAYWLSAIMILTSVASFYYYFSIIRQMFMRMADEESKIHVPYALAVIIWICAIVTLGLGIYPQIVLEYLDKVFDITKDFFML
jgi:NADH-quinone oxidoreductase subunit N